RGPTERDVALGPDSSENASCQRCRDSEWKWSQEPLPPARCDSKMLSTGQDVAGRLVVWFTGFHTHRVVIDGCWVEYACSDAERDEVNLASETLLIQPRRSQGLRHRP